MKIVKLSKRSQAYLFLLINTIVWGAALIVVKPSLEFTTPYRFLLYRFTLASMLSIPLLVHYWPKVTHKATHILRITGIELIGTTFALGILYAGLQRTSAIEASLINNTMPLFVMIGGVWLLKEKIQRHEVSGMLVAFGGALLLTFFPYFQETTTGPQLSILGNVLVLLSVASNMVYFPLAKKYFHRLPKFFAVTIGFYVGVLSFLLLSLMELNFSITQLLNVIRLDFTHLSVWVASFYMAIFGSIIGLTAYIKGQDGIEASEAVMFNYLQPLIYIPLGMLVLGEHLYPMQIVALVIIAGGVILAERRR